MIHAKIPWRPISALSCWSNRQTGKRPVWIQHYHIRITGHIKSWLLSVGIFARVSSCWADQTYLHRSTKIGPNWGSDPETPNPTVSGVGEIMAGSPSCGMTPFSSPSDLPALTSTLEEEQPFIWTLHTHHQNRKRLILGPKAVQHWSRRLVCRASAIVLNAELCVLTGRRS